MRRMHSSEKVCKTNLPTALLVEPFYGGSHKQMVDLISTTLREVGGAKILCYTMPPRKWHWRMLTSASHFASEIKADVGSGTLFASSMLNLAELVGYRKDLAAFRKILYFHENQLAYPTSEANDTNLTLVTDGTKSHLA